MFQSLLLFHVGLRYLFYFLYFESFIFYVSGDHSQNGIVVITESPSRHTRPQEITVIEHDTVQYNHQQDAQSQQRQIISNKTHVSYSSNNNNFGGSGGSSGGGGPAWHGKCPHCYHEYAIYQGRTFKYT